MLEIQALDVAIAGVPVLHGVDLAVPHGAIAALVGHNGAGKTTLMRAIMGLVAARDGAIRFDEVDLRALPAHARAGLGIGYMPEDRRLVPELTVEENVLLPVWASGQQAPPRASRGSTRSSPRSTTCAPARPRSSPAASRSSRRSPGRCSPGGACCCSTSRSRAWRRCSRAVSPRSSPASRRRASRCSCRSPTTPIRSTCSTICS